MFKKTLKVLFAVAAVFTVIAGVIYFINNKKNTVSAEDEELDPEEDHLDAAEALDLSSLKFSRHYVDLR